MLGYVNRSEQPVAGLERYADFYLRGQDGWREGERDGRSHELAQFRTREVPRADGFAVKLSIDANVQDIIEPEGHQIDGCKGNQYHDPTQNEGKVEITGVLIVKKGEIKSKVGLRRAAPPNPNIGRGWVQAELWAPSYQ